MVALRAHVSFVHIHIKRFDFTLLQFSEELNLSSDCCKCVMVDWYVCVFVRNIVTTSFAFPEIVISCYHLLVCVCFYSAFFPHFGCTISIFRLYRFLFKWLSKRWEFNVHTNAAFLSSVHANMHRCSALIILIFFFFTEQFSSKTKQKSANINESYHIFNRIWNVEYWVGFIFVDNNKRETPPILSCKEKSRRFDISRSFKFISQFYIS